MPVLSGIAVFPIKSLDMHVCDQAVIGPGGSLQHDREWAIVDDNGKLVNGKNCPSLFPIRSTFDLDQLTIQMRRNKEDSGGKAFHLLDDQAGIKEWLTQVLGFSVKLKRNQQIGFPDDEPNWGPTVVSKASLNTVTEWFGLSFEETWRRFRMNLVVDEVTPFWEDQLFGEKGKFVPFLMGTTCFKGIRPCPRCIVPSRDSRTGDTDKTFTKSFIERREANLPPGVAISQFKHYNMLSVNTQVDPSQAGNVLKIGDSVKIQK